MSEFLENFIEKIKSIYFSLEDKYYAFLDKVNEHIPIYKVIDPIDKVFPSFILFILLGVILLFFLISFVLGLTAVPSFSANILVTDYSSNPIEGITLTAVFADNQQSFTTNAEGLIKVPLKEEETSLKIKVESQNNFNAFERSVVLKDKETFKVMLQKKSTPGSSGGGHGYLQPKTYTLYFRDSSTSYPITEEVTVSFVCSGSGSIPEKHSSVGELRLRAEDIPDSCDKITATVSSPNYSSEVKELTTQLVYFNLTPNYVGDPDPITGTVIVTVSEFDGLPTANATVNLIDSNTSGLTDSSITLESGSVQFSNVQPGDYHIEVLSSDGRTLSSDEFHLDQEETEYVDLIFTEDNQPCTTDDCLQDNARKIFLRLIDSETQSPVSGASVKIFKNNSYLLTKTSDSNGIITQVFQDLNEGTSFAVVIEDPDYVLKVIDPVQLFSYDANEPMSVLLTPIDNNSSGGPVNYAILTVNIKDEQGNPVPDSKVWIYDASNTSVPLNSSSGDLTNDSGSVTFSNLPATSYIVKAESPDGEKTAEGSITLSEGDEKTITLSMVLGKGQVKVTVKDASTGNSLSGVLVEFFDVTNDSKLSECTTDVSGKCTSTAIDADRVVYVIASKDEYVPAQYPDNISIVSDSTASIQMDLTANADAPDTDFSVEFDALCLDESCNQTTTKIESDPSLANEYYLKFNVNMPREEDYSNTEIHIHAGSEDAPMLSSSDYKVRIDTVHGSISDNDIFLSTCYNTSDPFSNSFSDPDCSLISNENDGDKAKQVNIDFPDVTGPRIYSFTVQIEIEPGLAEGEEIKVSYAGRTTTTQDIRDPETDFKVLLFNIGEESCLFSGDALSLNLELENPDTSERTTLTTDTDNRIELDKDKEYNLYYSVFNCSNESFDNLALTIEADPNSNDNAKSIVLIDSSDNENYAMAAFEQELQSQQSISNEGNPIRIKGITQSDTTELYFALKPSTDDSSIYLDRTEYFKVKPLGSLVFENVPSSITVPPESNSITASVKTDEDNPQAISGALVSLYLSDSSTPNFTTQTNEDGSFTFNDIDFTTVSTARVTADYAGFNPAEDSITVNITPPTPIPIDYGCIGIEPKEKVIELDKHLSTNNSDSITFNANNCLEPVTINISSELSVSPDSFTLDRSDVSTASKTVIVKALPGNVFEASGEVYQGEYAIFISAKLDSDEKERQLKNDTIIVRIKDSGSCFFLLDPATVDPDSFDPSTFNPLNYPMKSLYNINHQTDSGLIYNQCYAPYDETTYPEFNLISIHKGVGTPINSDSIYFDSNSQGAGSVTTTTQTQSKDFTDDLGNPQTIDSTNNSFDFNVSDDSSPLLVNSVDFLMDDNQSNNLKFKLYYLDDSGNWNQVSYNDTSEFDILTDSRIYYNETITVDQKQCLDNASDFDNDNIIDLNWQYCVITPDTQDLNYEVLCSDKLDEFASCLDVTATGGNSCLQECIHNCPKTTVFDTCVDNCIADCSDEANAAPLNSVKGKALFLPSNGGDGDGGTGGTSCGNGICETGENEVNCLADCGTGGSTGGTDGSGDTGGTDTTANYTFFTVPVWQFKVQGLDEGLPVNALAKKLKLEVSGFSDDSEQANLYSAKLSVEVPQVNTTGDRFIKFNVSNKALNGAYNYGFFKLKDSIHDTASNSTKPMEEYFHLRLKANEAENCVLDDGTVGFTGSDAAPHVKFDWSWDTDFSCNSSLSDNIYCDPTQLTILLVKWLNSVETSLASQEGMSLEEYLQEFNDNGGVNVNLIEDNYNENFQQDFDNYYKNNSFMSTPSYYNDKWSNYIGNHDRFSFNVLGGDTQVLAGEYNVKFRIEYDDSTNPKIFTSDNPSAKITLSLTYLRPPVIDNIFYHLPFNGLVGTQSNGSISRTGYGLQINNSSNTSLDLTNSFSLPVSSSGAQAFNVIVEPDDFTLVHLSERGVIAKISDSTINFRPLRVIPVFASFESSDAYDPNGNEIKAPFAYVLTDSQGNPITVAGFLNHWTAVASSMQSADGKCVDFSDNPLFYNEGDSVYDASFNSNAYGFQNYNNLEQEKNNQKIFIYSLLYLPQDQENNLVFSSQEINNKNAAEFYVVKLDPQGFRFVDISNPHDFRFVDISNPQDSINASDLYPLSPNDNPLKYYTFNDILEGIKDNYICYYDSGDETSFYFNPQHLESVNDNPDDGWGNQMTNEGYCYSGVSGATTYSSFGT